MTERLGDGPIQEQYREKIKDASKTLDEFFNGKARGRDRDTGFVLLVFPFGTADEERCDVISNGAGREDIIMLFKKMIARFEGKRHPLHRPVPFRKRDVTKALKAAQDAGVRVKIEIVKDKLTIIPMDSEEVHVEHDGEEGQPKPW